MVEIVGGADGLIVRASHPLSAEADRIEASWALQARDEAFVEGSWCRSYEAPGRATDLLSDRVEMRRRIETTVEFWQAWMPGAGTTATGPRPSAAWPSC